MAVMIPRDVQIALAVDREADDVVSIPNVAAVLRLVRLPRLSARGAFREDHDAVGVVPAGVLGALVREKGAGPEDGGVVGGLRVAKAERRFADGGAGRFGGARSGTAEVKQ